MLSNFSLLVAEEQTVSYGNPTLRFTHRTARVTVIRADGYVATRLMFRLICNLPELSIRIFNPITSYF